MTITHPIQPLPHLLPECDNARLAKFGDTVTDKLCDFGKEITSDNRRDRHEAELDPGFDVVEHAEFGEEGRELRQPVDDVGSVVRVVQCDLGAVVDPEVCEHVGVEAERDDVGDQHGGRASNRLAFLVVEGRPCLGEVRLGETDVAGFLENVEPRDLPSNEMDPVVAHR